ncbi:uncharacterized protein CANTADRAFT_3954 [Suhomyces tanzawaensis NRRL Y-17324]|uniref:Uncharacterized protein n=1 Tax=Suhomyces tanzawaensis NRRL Y-17324 TaxID=984487 RepID=A0A1E4SQV0_9ASCO|nr:uncharacterized protein CANTADRAFT_3954 [Suhomyces tanzawaensis NRRL Y-17324]ODV81896.1 hypothetical protein CANTADRAFT_3954 [Suhomyces tanzawaensis NRRL Y-17324]
MDSLYTALSLGLIRNKRIVISTDSPRQTIHHFQHLIVHNLCHYEPNQFASIDVLDVLTHKNINELVLSMSSYSKSVYTFKNIVMWRNVSLLSHDHQKQLYELLTQIDQYDTNASKWYPTDTVDFRDITVRKPELFSIVLVVEPQYYQNKMYQYLKEKFWFSVNYPFVSEQVCLLELSKIRPIPEYQDHILSLRASWQKVYVSPDIKKYIYSLIVHMRNHRLSSLAPKQTRLPTRSIDDVADLTRALVLWQNDSEHLYATPDFVKVAIRKIGYWLVDWEYNELFANSIDSEHDGRRRRLEIDILSGDWYGSDYDYVNKYIEESRSKVEKKNPLGHSNRIVDEAIRKVNPPL